MRDVLPSPLWGGAGGGVVSRRARHRRPRPVPLPTRGRGDRCQALWAFLVEKRKAASLTQAEVAARLKIHQSYVADIERGQRRVDLVELIALAKAIGFDPHEAVERVRE